MKRMFSLVFEHLFGLNGPMSAALISIVEQVLAADLDDATVADLQAHVLELRTVAGRLLSRADQVLATLQERSGGRVLEHPHHCASATANIGASWDTGASSDTGACSGTDPVAGDDPDPMTADPAGPAAPLTPPAPAMPLLMSVQTWWREAARVAGVQAGRDVRRAQVLARFPAWGQAVTDGILTPAQAEVLCRLAGRLPDTELEACQAELVTVASALNPMGLGQWVRHLIATWCEPDLDREQDRAEATSWLQLDKRPDGRLAGRFVISSENSEALLTVLEPLARPQGLTDARTAGQRRADALVDVFTAAAKWLHLPTAGGRPVHVSYVVPSGWACGDTPPSLSDLLRLRAITLTDPGRSGGQQHPPEDLRPRPEPLRSTKTATDPRTGAARHPIVLEEHVATAAWTGPQTRARLEATLCDARISRVLRDALGQVISLQSLTDQITTAQRKAVSARDRHCVARGCTRPPAFTDLHHLVHREDGGSNDLDNLVLLCRRHHLMWHRGRLTPHDLHTPWLQHAA